MLKSSCSKIKVSREKLDFHTLILQCSWCCKDPDSLLVPLGSFCNAWFHLRRPWTPNSKNSKVAKMEILIFHFACYRSCFMIWKASICYLEWIWTKTLRLLVQVFEIRCSCGKMHFLEILEGDFEFDGFSDDCDDPKSSRVSFMSDLNAHFVHFGKISWDGLICSFLQFWLILRYDLVLCLCLGVYGGLIIFKSSL